MTLLFFFALIFASPLVLSLKTHKQNCCDLFLYRVSKMLSYQSSQIKLVYCSMVPIYWSIFSLPLAWPWASIFESSLAAFPYHIKQTSCLQDTIICTLALGFLLERFWFWPLISSYLSLEQSKPSMFLLFYVTFYAQEEKLPFTRLHCYPVSNPPLTFFCYDNYQNFLMLS